MEMRYVKMKEATHEKLASVWSSILEAKLSSTFNTPFAEISLEKWCNHKNFFLHYACNYYLRVRYNDFILMLTSIICSKIFRKL